MGIYKSKNISVTEYWKGLVTKISESYTFGTCEFIDYIPPQIESCKLGKYNDEGKDIADFILDYMKYENARDLQMNEFMAKDSLKAKFDMWLYEPIFKGCNYIDYMREILNKNI